MSYYANYGGTITVKDAQDCEAVMDIIEKYELFDDIVVSARSGKKIGVSGYQKYYDYDFKKLYKEIGEYVEEADIYFTGEDGPPWKHTFEDGEWKEYSGEVVYKDPCTFAELNTTKDEKEL